MARPLRLHVPGGFYHVTLRGNHRQPIFFTAADRNLLDRIVEDALDECTARLHAYCWMTNHVHLLLQVADKPLGAVMHRIAGTYARKVQHRLETTGHLFERRYHALLVDADAYLLTLLRYIHFNPVRAGLAADPSAYAWSSHTAYLGLRERRWITTDFALTLFGSSRTVARARYREFMRAPGQERWGEGALQPNQNEPLVLGNAEFLARIGGRTTAAIAHVSLDQLIDECARKFRVSRILLASACRNQRLSAARAWLAREVVSSGVLTVSGIARELQRSETAVRRLLARHARTDEDEHVRNV